MAPLRRLVCDHESHGKIAGGTKDSDGNWESSESAAYPPELNLYLSKAIINLNHSGATANPNPEHSVKAAEAASDPDRDEPADSVEPTTVAVSQTSAR
jgi:hypothetical protein